MWLGRAGAEKPARHDHRPLNKGTRTMPRQRKSVPGVDAKLLIKDAGKLLPRAVAPAVPARRREPRRARHAQRLRHHRRRYVGERAARHFRLQRSRSGAAVQSAHAGAGISGKHDYPSVPIQRLLQRGRGAGSRRRALPARDRRPCRQQETVDAPGTLQAAGSFADHTPCLRRRLERHRLLAGRAPVRFSQAGRRRH